MTHALLRPGPLGSTSSDSSGRSERALVRRHTTGDSHLTILMSKR